MDFSSFYLLVQASQCPTQVGLSDICTYNVDGSKVSNVVFPYRLKLYSPNVQFPTSSVDTNGLLNMLSTIPPGTTLFEVYTFASPQGFAQDNGILLGEIVTTSECTASAFGDNNLFFRHQRIEEDWTASNSFLSTNADAECDAASLNLNPPTACPSHS